MSAPRERSARAGNVVRWLGRALPVLLVAAVPTTVIVLHATRLYPKFFFDDSFISLRYADRLRHGHGLTWTDGERVEGITNLLWVLMIAGGGVFDHDLVEVARTLGLVASAATIVAFAWLYARRSLRDAPAALWGGLALALSGPVAAWTTAGLEGPLILATVAWGAAFVAADVAGDAPRPGYQWAAGACLGAACLTRPDAPLFVAGLAGGALITTRFKRRGWAMLTRVVAIPVACTVGHMAFSRLYYGAWLPNTSSKLPSDTAMIHRGWDYITGGWESRIPLVDPAFFALVVATWNRRVRQRVILFLPPLVLWVGYIALIGGDFMPQKRQLVPAILFVALIGAEAFAWVSERPSGAVTGSWLVGTLALWLGLTQTTGPDVKDANNDRWYWDGRPIGAFFRHAFGDKDPLLAVDAAGALPYFSGLRALDMLGLNDRYLSTHPPKNPERGPLAHSLGDGAYVLRRKPDLVVFHLPYGREHGMWRSGQEMERAGEFRRLYSLVHYRTPEGVQGMVYVRQEDGPLGIRRSTDRIAIPGYLFDADDKTRAVIDPSGKVAEEVAPHDAALLPVLELPGGMWCGHARGQGALSLSLVARTTAQIEGACITLAGKRSQVGVLVASSSGKGWLESVEFVKQGAP